MKVAALQMDIVKLDKAANLAKVRSLIGDSGVNLVVLPELFSTGYAMADQTQARSLAEEVPGGPTTEALAQIAREKNCHIVGTIIEKEQDELCICALVVGPEGYIGKQCKRHLTSLEQTLYSPGTTSSVFDIGGCRIGVLVCFEGWFPESARELILQGAQILCHSALISNPRSLDIMRVRAIENRAYVIVTNSMYTDYFGTEPCTFRGESRVIDFDGELVAQAAREEALVLAEIDPALTLVKDLPDCDDLLSEIRKHHYL